MWSLVEMATFAHKFEKSDEIRHRNSAQRGDVADSEANLKEKKIASSTPIAKGLLGKRVGDIVEIKVPQGVMTFEIVKIEIL